MGRRKRNDEIAFGSDSFLDIVANIVGILIILIVIAGVRVSQMPALRETTVSNTPPHNAAIKLPVAAVPASMPEPVNALAVPRPLPTPPPAIAVQPQNPAEPPPELVSRVQHAEQEVARLSRAKQVLAARLQATTESPEAIRNQIAESRATLQKEKAVTENGRRVIAALQTDVETKQRAIAGLHLELAETEAAQPPPQVLRHKLTPLGKEVNGEERDFLLSNGRVAVVPVKELIEELNLELLRKRSQLLRGQTRVGTVGPINGFSMEYVVVMVGISELRLIPQATLVTESYEEALHPMSRFLGALRQSAPDATLTFWVYPDSFTLYRQLQEFAHDNGFNVAGRPLPFEIPITRSSRGSRSLAQ